MLNTAQQRILRERANTLRRRLEKALKDGATDAEVDALTGEVKALRRLKEQVDDGNALADQVDAMRASFGGPAGKGLAQQVLDAGFDLKAAPSVAVSGYQALGVKAASTPDMEDLNPRGPVGLASMGRDERWLWTALNRQDAGDATAIEDFRQTTRAVTGNVERAIDATTEKAELNLGIEHVVEPMRQLAILLSDIPNVVLTSMPSFRDFFNGEARFQIEAALDAHVVGRILAGDPPAGTTGEGLVAQIRQAVAAMRAEGANPSVLALSPSDAADLDLYEDAGGLVFATRDTGSSSPVWGLRVVEHAEGGDPLLIDPGRLGPVYVGGLRIDADPYSKFNTNQTRLRFELSALAHIRDITAVRRIGTTS